MHVLRYIGMVLFLLMVSVPAEAQQRGAAISIGAGQRGGAAYSTAGAICRSLNNLGAGLCRVLSTGGSIDNLYALSLADANFAIVQADIAANARQGVRGFPGEYENLRAITPLYTKALTVITRADSDVWVFSDLAGRRVAAGTPLSGSYWTFRALLETISIGGGALPAVMNVDARDGAALCKGTLDAVVMVTGHPSLMLSRMAYECPIRLVPLGMAEVRGMSAHSSNSYRPMNVPPGLYPFAPAPVPTIGTDAMLVALATTPDYHVNTMLRAIFGGDGAFGQQPGLPMARPVPPSALPRAMHPAAMRFFYRGQVQ